MAPPIANESKISIKVLVDTEKNKVVYAVADHSFVDILFSFMTIPMGTIVRLLSGKQADKKFEALGSLNNLYQSIVDLPECYLSMEEFKFMLLNPRNSVFDYCSKLKLKIDDTKSPKYFTCESWSCIDRYRAVSFSNMARCKSCGKLMDREVCFKDSTVSGNVDCLGGGGVFVSDITTFVVTDDLCVMPYAPGCCIQLLINLGITESSQLEERTVEFDREKVLELLKFALSVTSPLTYLVLHTTHSIQDLVHARADNFDQSYSNEEDGLSSVNSISMEVSLQKSTGKVLFAEVEEDFLDFVIGFLGIPFGAVSHYLKNGTSIVCMENIYKSILNMSVGRYIKSDGIKNILLEPPPVRTGFPSRNQIFSLNRAFFPPIYLSFPSSYGPNWWSSCYVTFDPKYKAATYSLLTPGNKLLKQSGMFVVTDDLRITPSSSISTIAILNKLKVPLNDIERRKVVVGLEGRWRMLKASLISSSTLTKALEPQLKKLK